MPFTMQCISSDYVSLWAHSPASLRGDYFHQDLHPPLPCNSWPCWCLPDLKALIVFNPSENLLPDTARLASQFSDVQNMLAWNQTNRKTLVDKVTDKKRKKKEGVSACETKAVVHWESGSIWGTILANASVPMIPHCCYGKLPPASPHLWRTAAVYPLLPTALPTALPR